MCKTTVNFTAPINNQSFESQILHINAEIAFKREQTGGKCNNFDLLIQFAKSCRKLQTETKNQRNKKNEIYVSKQKVIVKNITQSATQSKVVRISIKL